MLINEYSCPYCLGSLKSVDNSLICFDCNRKFDIKGNMADLHLSEMDFTNRDMLSFFNKHNEHYESLPYFSSLYGFYGNLKVHPIKRVVPYVTMTIKNMINDMLEVDGKVALDVACGTGIYTRSIAKTASMVHGIDMSEGMLKTAREYAELFNLNNIVFTKADVNNLPFRDNYFDGISCCCALHLFKDLNKALNEMNRVLKQGCKIACLTYLRTKFWGNKPIYKILLKERGIQFFHVTEIEKYLENSGFRDFKYYTWGSMIIFEAKKCRN